MAGGGTTALRKAWARVRLHLEPAVAALRALSPWAPVRIFKIEMASETLTNHHYRPEHDLRRYIFVSGVRCRLSSEVRVYGQDGAVIFAAPREHIRAVYDTNLTGYAA